jgi:BCCT family betaine/carnitine transporter
MEDGKDPVLFNRAFWAIALGGIALALMKLGGLGPVKTSSLVVGVPLVFLMGISYFSVLKWLREDKANIVFAKSKTDPELETPDPHSR